jgi:hypothetical protein
VEIPVCSVNERRERTPWRCILDRTVAQAPHDEAMLRHTLPEIEFPQLVGADRSTVGTAIRSSLLFSEQVHAFRLLGLPVIRSGKPIGSRPKARKRTLP